MKILKSVDKGIEKLVNMLVIISMILILSVVFFQVVARFFHFSIGGFEELPVYLMLTCTWLTAAVHVKKKGHISLNLAKVFIKNEKANKIIQLITTSLTAIVFILFSVISLETIIYNFEMGYETPGMKIPYWILIALVVFCTTLMAIYYVKDIIDEIKEVKTWK